MVEEVPGADLSVERRRVLRAGALVAGAAWAAPVVVDSLASPAAAATSDFP
ncbi:MAG: hypothetical protein KDB02_04695 [Acidimicrobiales bacterium]|nr:hypothetical protein [Acidimicrobiales bacterium]